MDKIVYGGKQYTRTGTKWVDRDQFVVPVYMQDILNRLFIEQELTGDLDRGTLIKRADQFKNSGSYQYAISFYLRALEGADSDAICFILPKLTSCYRAVSSPKKAVEAFEKYVEEEGEVVVSTALLVSAAAAYCDVGDATTAYRLCKWAYKKFKMRGKDPSGELNAVYARVAKILDLPKNDIEDE